MPPTKAASVNLAHSNGLLRDDGVCATREAASHDDQSSRSISARMVPANGANRDVAAATEAHKVPDSNSDKAIAQQDVPIPKMARGRKLGFDLATAGKTKRQKVKSNIFGAAAEEEEAEEMPAEAKALMKNLGSQTIKAGCQSSSQGYYYAPRPWDTARQRPANVSAEHELGTTYRRS